MLSTIDLVVLITTQSGADLIVSFAVGDPSNPSSILSLTLIRTPKYEFVVPDYERGVSVSWERHSEAADMLEAVTYSEAEQMVLVQTSAREHKLDVRKVTPRELAAMRQVLHLMNFDQQLELTGI